MSSINFDTTYAQIDLDAIAANMDAIQAKVKVPVMAIVKADAYGHGAVAVAGLLKDKCPFFGVSAMQEALELRRAGIQNPILILGYTPVSAYETAIRQGIRPAIFHWEDAVALSKAAVETGLPGIFHFALDTGMSRIGFQVTREDADLCAKIAALPALQAEGLFSHLATADCLDLSRAKVQEARFNAFDAMLKEQGLEIPIRHLNNSAGLMNFENQYDMVRAGIALYGLYPSDEVDPALLPLKPAMSLRSQVTHVKTLPPGREISYGGAFVTARETVVATIPVGYADGYRRNLSGRFHVLIRGRKAPILGRVCMDQMMVDVTDIPGVVPGDPVTLMGRDGGEVISAEQIAAQADSFNYEFVCGVSRRVPRVYLREGREIHRIHYLSDSIF